MKGEGEQEGGRQGRQPKETEWRAGDRSGRSVAHHQRLEQHLASCTSSRLATRPPLPAPNPTDAGGAGPDGELGGATAVHVDVHQWIFWNIYTIIPRVNLALLGHQPYQH